MDIPLGSHTLSCVGAWTALIIIICRVSNKLQFFLQYLVNHHNSLLESVFTLLTGKNFKLSEVNSMRDLVILG